MLMNRSVRAAALLLACLGLVPAAQAETPREGVPYVFETVDSYHLPSIYQFEVTGILRGESTPRTFTFWSRDFSSFEPAQHLSRCDRMALLAMSKPGAYFLEVVQPTIDRPIPTCKLTRRQAP